MLQNAQTSYCQCFDLIPRCVPLCVLTCVHFFEPFLLSYHTFAEHMTLCTYGTHTRRRRVPRLQKRLRHTWFQSFAMYICMYVCTRMQAHTNARTHTKTHARTHTNAHVKHTTATRNCCRNADAQVAPTSRRPEAEEIHVLIGHKQSLGGSILIIGGKTNMNSRKVPASWQSGSHVFMWLSSWSKAKAWRGQYVNSQESVLAPRSSVALCALKFETCKRFSP